MTDSNFPKSNRALVVYFCAAAVILVALAVLFGWFFDIAYLKSLVPNYPIMKPNTAVAFAIAGIGLFFTAKADSGAHWRYAAMFCGIAASLIGFTTLGEYVMGFDFGIDTLLIPAEIVGGDIHPGRMSPHSAFNFTILGIALTFLGCRPILRRVSEFLAFFVAATTFAALLGYLYHAEQLYGISRYNSMAVHTAGLFFVYSLGLLAANSDSRAVKLLASDSLGGSAARRLLPVVVLVPTIFGWLRLLGQESGFYDTGFGAALNVFLSVVLMFAIIFYYSETVHKVDQKRKLVEKELAEKEMRFRDLFDYSQGMICIHDLDGILTTVNPAAAASLGYAND